MEKRNSSFVIVLLFIITAELLLMIIKQSGIRTQSKAMDALEERLIAKDDTIWQLRLQVSELKYEIDHD